MQIDVFERRHLRLGLPESAPRPRRAPRTSAGVSLLRIRAAARPARRRRRDVDAGVEPARRLEIARRVPATRTISAAGRQPLPERRRPVEREQRSCSTATRSASRSASSRLCVDTRIAQPAARRSSSSCRTLRVTSGSRPDVGSSSSRTAGSCSSARASATFCRMPFDSSAARVDRRGRSARTSRARDRRAVGVARARRGRRRRCRFSRTVRRSQRPGDSVRNPIRLRSADAGGARQRHAVDRDRAARRRDQPRQHPHRRRLAGAVRAEQRDDLAAPDLERHVVDGGARERREAGAVRSRRRRSAGRSARCAEAGRLPARARAAWPSDSNS